MEARQQSAYRPTSATPLDGRARWHYGVIAEAIATMRQALAGTSKLMDGLAAHYRRTVGWCRLVLYRKRRNGAPTSALYWGRAFDVPTANGPLRLREHLRGRRLSGRAIFHVARRWREREVFFDFDRKRRALNARHARLAHALQRIGLSLGKLALPAERLPAARVMDDGLLDRAWRVAWALTAVEQDMLTLARGARPAPIAPYARVSRDGYVALGWAEPVRVRRGGVLRGAWKHVRSELSRDVRHAFGIASAWWAKLRAVDRRMRVLRREHERYARVVGRCRRCARTLCV
jgi:hypothetical protein